MKPKKMWGGRFQSEEDPYFALFNRSLGFDYRLLDADIEGSVAYAAALGRAGVLTQAESRRLILGLRRTRRGLAGTPAAVSSAPAEDVHTWVEQKLEEQVGVLARKLHTGRSRNDQVATDLRIYLAGRGAEIRAALARLLEAIALLANRASSTILPGYTHLQRAQPVTFGHFMLAYAEMLLRDMERLADASRRASTCPLGAGALAGTPYRIDRRLLARELGFRAPCANSMDAVSDRDFVLDFLFFAAVTMMHLSRLAEDLILYSSSEFGFVELDDSVSSGSSLMPQKKNPDALELIRGKTGRVYGHLTGLMTVLKGLPLTYNKDLQEDKEGLFDALDTLQACLEMTRRVLGSIRLRPDRMREAASGGFINATELADYLVARGMPFREAHHLTGRIVRRAIELGCGIEDLSLPVLRSFSPLVEGGVYACLRVGAAVARRGRLGGTAPPAVRRAARRLLLRLRRERPGKAGAKPTPRRKGRDAHGKSGRMRP